MSITLDHSEIKDKIDDGKLVLYFTHDIELDKKVENVKFVQWLNYWGFKVKKEKDKTTVLYPHSFNLKECFYKRYELSYLQSFNKDITHSLDEKDFLSLIFSKALVSMGVTKETCSILKEDFNTNKSLRAKTMSYNSFCKHIKYNIDNIFYEKNLILDDKIVKSLKKDKKENLYNDFYVIENLIGRIVFLKTKSNKKDVSYIQKHYKNKKNLQFLSIGTLSCVGLDTYKDKVFYSNIISHLNSIFTITELSHNVLIGLIFSKNMGEDIKIDLSDEKKIKYSPGYFVTKTFIDLKSNGIIGEDTKEFNSNVLQYYFIKSLWYYSPNILFNALVVHCDKINKILNNKDFNLSEDENVTIFLGGLLEDLELGMKSLGMFLPEHIYD